MMRHLCKRQKESDPGTTQAVPNSAPVEHATGAEPTLQDLATACGLLREHGYELLDRFGHVHATTAAQELHVCLLADLTAMSPSQLLACLDEAIQQSLQYVLSRQQ